MSSSRERSNSPHRSRPSPEPSSQTIGTHVCICTHTSRVPRPRNAFILYRQHHHSIVVAENPGKSNPEISKIIGEQWRSLPQKEKEFWIHLGDEEKKSHLERFPDYRYQPRRSSKRNSSASSSSYSNAQSSNDSGICPVCKGITPAGLNQSINNVNNAATNQQNQTPQQQQHHPPPPPPAPAGTPPAGDPQSPHNKYPQQFHHQQFPRMYFEEKHSSTSSSSSRYSAGSFSSISSSRSSAASLASRSSVSSDAAHPPHASSGLPRIIPRPQDELPSGGPPPPPQQHSPATPPPGSQVLAWPFNYPRSPHDSPPPPPPPPKPQGFAYPPPHPHHLAHHHPAPVPGPLSTVQEEELRAKKRRMSSHYDPVSQLPQATSRMERYQSAVALVTSQQQQTPQISELSVREKADILSMVCEPAAGVGPMIAVEGKDHEMVQRLCHLLSERLEGPTISDGLFCSSVIARDQPHHLTHPAAVNMWKIAWLHQLVADLPTRRVNYTVLGGYLMAIADELAMQDPVLPKYDNRPPPASSSNVSSAHSSPGLSSDTDTASSISLAPRPASTGGFAESDTHLDYRHRWMSSVNMLKGLPAPDYLVYVQSAGLTQAEVAVAELKSGMKMLVLGGNKNLEDKLVDKIYDVIIQQQQK